MYLCININVPSIGPGNWNSWSPWGDCSVTCGGSIKQRYRLCNDPEPSNGGADCEGEAVEVEECNTQKCPGMHTVEDHL